MFASMEILNMTNETYSNYHKKISAAVENNLEQLMNEAGKEESKLAIQNGDITAEVIPVISVMVDGAWSKHSYRTNYSALSGVACIIGVRTKRVLYIGVKNKYCYVCSRSNMQQRDRYKNWN